MKLLRKSNAPTQYQRDVFNYRKFMRYQIEPDVFFSRIGLDMSDVRDLKFRNAMLVDDLCKNRKRYIARMIKQIERTGTVSLNEVQERLCRLNDVDLLIALLAADAVDTNPQSIRTRNAVQEAVKYGSGAISTDSVGRIVARLINPYTTHVDLIIKSAFEQMNETGVIKDTDTYRFNYFVEGLRDFVTPQSINILFNSIAKQIAESIENPIISAMALGDLMTPNLRYRNRINIDVEVAAGIAERCRDDLETRVKSGQLPRLSERDQTVMLRGMELGGVIRRDLEVIGYLHSDPIGL